MTFFDTLVLFILLCSSIIGSVRGFIKEALTLVSWIIAFFVANVYAPEVAKNLPFAQALGDIPQLIVAFMLVVIAVKCLSWLLTEAIASVIGAVTLLHITNRFLGAIFGLARGVLITLIMVWLGTLTTLPYHNSWRDAATRPWIEQISHWAWSHLPPAFFHGITHLQHCIKTPLSANCGIQWQQKSSPASIEPPLKSLSSLSPPQKL